MRMLHLTRILFSNPYHRYHRFYQSEYVPTMTVKILCSILMCHCILVAFWVVHFYNSGHEFSILFEHTRRLQQWLTVIKTFCGGFGLGSSLLLATETFARVSLGLWGCNVYTQLTISSFLAHFFGITAWFIAFIVEQCFTFSTAAHLPDCKSQYTYLHFMMFFGVFAEVLLGICLFVMSRNSWRYQYERYESYESL